MQKMIIYKAEASVPGLAEKIAQARVISYIMPLTPWKSDISFQPDKTLAKELFPDWVSAGANDSDLYYTKSVLVTTNWNKNTDVFDKVETWSARATPTHKPTNIEHDEKQLVGHITDCFGMTTDYQLIPDNIVVDDLPDVYHLVNGAVIYRGWRDSDLAARANTLIEQIEKGEKYVSMECMFSNFNYAVICPDGKFNVIARDEGSSWITKHLKAYGGTGEYNGYKFGRLLKNITFSGKGYVDRPANPDSIIFNDTSMFNFAAATQENPFILNSGVYFNRTQADTERENNPMASELEILKAQIDELKVQLADTSKTKASLEDKLAKADTAKFESRITELENLLANTKTELDTSKKSVEELTAKCDEEMKKMEKEKKAKGELEEKIAEMAKAQLTANRITMLVEGGLEREVAEKKVTLYANLNDEQFKDLATDLIAAFPPKQTDEQKKAADDKKKKEAADKAKATETTPPVENDTNADTAILDTAKTSDEPALAATSEEVDETAELRKDLRKALASRLGIKLEGEDSK
jgi:hypothetical protein